MVFAASAQDMKPSIQIAGADTIRMLLLKLKRNRNTANGGLSQKTPDSNTDAGICKAGNAPPG